MKLGELALQTPVLAEIVAMPHAEIPPAIGGVDNSNKLLGTHGVDGIKTGTTDDAANLLYSADYPVGDTTVTIVGGVLLNADDHAQIRTAVAALLDSVAPGFHRITALTAGTELASYTTPWATTPSHARPTEHRSSSGATRRWMSRCRSSPSPSPTTARASAPPR